MVESLGLARLGVVEQEQQRLSEPTGDAAELEQPASTHFEDAGRWAGLPPSVELSRAELGPPGPNAPALTAEIGSTPTRTQAALEWWGLRPPAGTAVRPNRSVSESVAAAATWLRLTPAGSSFPGYRPEPGPLKLGKRLGWMVLAVVTGLLVLDCALGLLAWLGLLVTVLIMGILGEPAIVPWELLAGLPLVFGVGGVLSWLPLRLAVRKLRSR